MDQIKRFIGKIPEDVDAVLIRSFPNRFYFTGFGSSAGTLFFTREDAYFIIDSRYIELAQQKISNCIVLLETNLEGQLRDLIQKHCIQIIGTETGYLNYLEINLLAEQVKPAQLLLDDRVNTAILNQRKIKTAEEIDWLRTAQRITDEAFSQVLDTLRIGSFDLDGAIALGTYMSKHGSERRSYDFIFTSGSNTSLPHGSSEVRRIGAGDFVMMDMGSLVAGYGSDMTRTVAVGKASAEQKEIYEIVLQAQQRALEKIRPGVVCCEVDAAARDFIADAGYGNCFGHGLGHSLGVEIHENPRFNQVCTEKLQPGMIMTVEPGIYLPGKFGVRIEDMIVITEDGYENLTHSPKHLIELDA